MHAAAASIAELVAPTAWRTVDCLSDLHLDAAHPRTLAALEAYLARTRADAVFILGDLFEVWVGDDAIAEAGSFEAEVCAMLRVAARRRPTWFMHGNRDFLVGEGFSAATGIALLADPTVLALRTGRWLLSHGDALCLADVQYQQFRAMVRESGWQARLLAEPLAARRAQARAMRDASEARRHAGTMSMADVDTPTAIAWLRGARATALVHGHTHRPADHALAPGLARHVLTDWDLDTTPTRAGVLRLSAADAERLTLDAAG